MSFDFRDYPDVSGQCWLCKKYDCSKPGEKWLHILGGLTDGDYHPAIGRKCLELIFANSDLPKPEPEVREVVRPPTDAEIVAALRRHFRLPEVLEIIEEGLRDSDDGSPDDKPSDEPADGGSTRSAKHRAKARAKGTV